MGQTEMKYIFNIGKNISLMAKATQMSNVANGPLVIYVTNRDGDFNSFRDIKALPVSVGVGDRTTLNCHDLHTIRCSLTHGTRMYMVYGWGSRYISGGGVDPRGYI
jgi:hypothetical protein